MHYTHNLHLQCASCGAHSQSHGTLCNPTASRSSCLLFTHHDSAFPLSHSCHSQAYSDKLPFCMVGGSLFPCIRLVSVCILGTIMSGIGCTARYIHRISNSVHLHLVSRVAHTYLYRMWHHSPQAHRLSSVTDLARIGSCLCPFLPNPHSGVVSVQHWAVSHLTVKVHVSQSGGVLVSFVCFLCVLFALPDQH